MQTERDWVSPLSSTAQVSLLLGWPWWSTCELMMQVATLMSTCLDISTHSAFDLHHHTIITCISFHHYFYLFIHAGSPNVTSLTFDNQSRTLTCTSTGGPATTVTWRRDGVVITLNATHQQTKRLVDNVTATYQTVLTIDPLVSQDVIVGTYNCTVENDKGESSETVFVTGEACSLVTYQCCR